MYKPWQVVVIYMTCKDTTIILTLQDTMQNTLFPFNNFADTQWPTDLSQLSTDLVISW